MEEGPRGGTHEWEGTVVGECALWDKVHKKRICCLFCCTVRLDVSRLSQYTTLEYPKAISLHLNLSPRASMMITRPFAHLTALVTPALPLLMALLTSPSKSVGRIVLALHRVSWDTDANSAHILWTFFMHSDNVGDL